MVAILTPNKPLAVNPLKTSLSLGAVLAFLGLGRSVPLMHGAQGCTAFGKVYFVRHFREQIPVQTTAMDQISTIMGADENIVAALKTIADKSQPEIIGLISTSLSETQGCDLRRAVAEFRAAHPEHAGLSIVPINAPDTPGSLEAGHALAVSALIDALVPASRMAGRRKKQVNVLASATLTPADVEALREWIAAFGLRAVILPDLGDSLDGHLIDAEYTPLTLGGTPRQEIAAMGESVATLVIGAAQNPAADLLRTRTGVPDYRFPGLMGLAACDALTQALAEISGQPVPAGIERQRAQLQDAMVDSHFMLGFTRVALAGDADLLAMLAGFLNGVGAEVVHAVAPAKGAALQAIPLAAVTVGDLEDFERGAAENGAQLLIASAHAGAAARRLRLPLLRAGFPQYDRLGGHARVWIGYRGSRQALFDIANLMLENHHELEPYRSLYWRGTARDGETAGAEGPLPATGLVHA